ncbi:hypothetical protein Ccrd_009528 [Cynara cardunculus var. scolymus]|uniref:Uncharacterized protein n=1 Tax=Cynara cardunculus var. scolymus TaxID=59895 RepID=A0A103YMV8_CYNCS|nr:hypothetical protein Ccrd_009528 [Cynara cardunculus var. scolymus]
MSIISPSVGLGKTIKNFVDADHPDLLRFPFLDQTYSIPKHFVFKEIGSQTFLNSEGNLRHKSHQHPLILVATQCNDITKPTSSNIKPLSCHNPMKKVELLCNGCLKPIMAMPFYKCLN